MQRNIDIRETSERDLPGVIAVLRDAFGSDEEARLVTALLEDLTAQPCLSLAACSGDSPLAYILFTRASLSNARRAVSASILAPLAVATRAQGQGIGGRLIAGGLNRLAEKGTELVFVLGYPDYYTRHGFRPAAPLGFVAPYPIPEKDADAWMVQALNTSVTGTLQGQVSCAASLDRPEYWQE